MNYLDFILIIPLLYAVWRGFIKGFIVEIFTLLALLVGLYAAVHFSDWTSLKIQENTSTNWTYLPVISFTITFLAVGAMVYFLGKTIEKLINFAHLSPVNKLLGVLFSLLKMLYILSVLIVLFESYDKNENVISKKDKTEATLYTPIKSISIKTIPYIEEAKFYINAHFSDSTLADSLKFLPHSSDELKKN